MARKSKKKKLKEANKKFWRWFLIIKVIILAIILGLLIYALSMFKQRIL